MTAQARRYPLKGRVVAIENARKTITVDQERIPGFMGAMTMPYAVKDEHQLDHVSAGERITATVVSSGNEYWLENVAPAKRTEF